MRKFLYTLLMLCILSQASFAAESQSFFKAKVLSNDTKAVKKLLNSQVKYANKTDFTKFIATYDENYTNSDGFNLETYSSLIKDIWDTYDNIKYGIKIRNININNDSAVANIEETSFAYIPVVKNLDGILKSKAESVYYLKKINGKWLVTSDSVVSEMTSMMYGDAKFIDVKLSAPQQIEPNKEYTATLEFTPPAHTIAIASIAMDKIEYPQQPTKEVFRKLGEDNILERLFISNSDNTNEYVVASIGLTKADIDDMNIKLKLSGFGYKITRVNVIPAEKADKTNSGVEQSENGKLE